MSIYFALIAVVLLIPVVCAGTKTKDIRDRRILVLSIIAVFFVMALKAPSVGRDIESYRSLYEMMAFRSWNNYDISWMEKGYELLTMIFVHVFHASFQTFMACVYGFLYYSYYKFFRRYSRDYTTSILLYICFTFFTFDTSAIRTMLGVAICLFAVPFAEKKGWKNTVFFIVITLLASQIHKSAYIFFAAYFVIKVRFSIKSAILYIGIPAALLAFRSQLFVIINLYFKSVTESGSAVGGNMVVYIICLVLTVVIWFFYDKDKGSRDTDLQMENNNELRTEEDVETTGNELTDFFNTSGLAMRMIYMGIIVQLFSAGSVLARMAQYMLFFVLVLVPNNIARLNTRSRIMVKMLLYLFAIIYFWRYSLYANALDIVPYRFFWNTL